MMARCASKARPHDIEPKDLRSVTQRAAAAAAGIPLTGTRAAWPASCAASRLETPQLP